MSRTAGSDALETLAAWNMISRDTARAWSVVAATSLKELAEHFGALEAVAAQHRSTKSNAPSGKNGSPNAPTPSPSCSPPTTATPDAEPPSLGALPELQPVRPRAAAATNASVAVRNRLVMNKLSDVMGS
jgi:hypothetical protein